MSEHVLAVDSTLSDFNQLIWWMVLLKVAIVFVFLLLTTIFMIWFERRVIGRMQNRPRPSGRCHLARRTAQPARADEKKKSKTQSLPTRKTGFFFFFPPPLSARRR